jgi:hypothetical protein
MSIVSGQLKAMTDNFVDNGMVGDLQIIKQGSPCKMQPAGQIFLISCLS